MICYMSTIFTCRGIQKSPSVPLVTIFPRGHPGLTTTRRAARTTEVGPRRPWVTIRSWCPGAAAAPLRGPTAITIIVIIIIIIISLFLLCIATITSLVIINIMIIISSSSSSSGSSISSIRIIITVTVINNHSSYTSNDINSKVRHGLLPRGAGRAAGLDPGLVPRQ